MDWTRFLLVILTFSLLALLLYSLSHELNWSKTAVAISTATYCQDFECLGKQVVASEYIYPDEQIGCHSTTRVFKYFIMAGKVLIPQYDTYYIRPETCQVLYIVNP